MLSYRHSFHAGNHADVLKHLCVMLVLEKLTIKAKPAIYIDTHSGAGLYDLVSKEANKTKEYRSGVSKILQYDGNNAVIRRYQSLIKPYIDKEVYPGSPVIAKAILREQDKLVLMEFHNTEIQNLKDNVIESNIRGKIAIHHRDGFEGLLAISPPKPSRGLVLIDPPYEVFSEYQQVAETLEKTIKKWRVGTFMIWYPLLSKRAGIKSGESQRMRQKLASLDVKNCLNVELCVDDPQHDCGMYGSGLVIINAPWQVDESLADVLPDLHKLLATASEGSDDQKGFSVEWLKQEIQAE